MSEKRQKIVLILGATGFIGRNMLEFFSKNTNYKIRAVNFQRPVFKTGDSCQVEWQTGDLRSQEFVDNVMRDVDFVIQAAATTSGSKDIVNSPYLHVTDNAIMNSLLLRSAFEHQIEHFIFFSCTVMYQSSELPLRESDFDANEQLVDRYFGVGNTKIYIEKMLEFYSSISNIKTTAIRHSNIYGPHDKFDFERSHVFGATVSKVLLANTEVVVWGEGNEERDLLHVDDLVSFVDLALRNQSRGFELLNCGGGEKVSINALVSQIIDASGKDLKIKHDLSQPSIPTALVLNCDQATKQIGWSPSISLSEGISSTIEWWRANIDPTTLKTRGDS